MSPLPPTYQFKTTPYTHQKNALEKGWDIRGFAYLMDMGTGKTKTALDNVAMLYQRGSVDTVLVLSNKGSYAGWYSREIPTHFPEIVLAQTKAVLWRGASTKLEQKSLQNLLTEGLDGLRILVMNVEALSSAKGKGLAMAEMFLKSGAKPMIIVDESTTIKNHAAARTKNVQYLGKLAIARRILTGSPVTQSPLDLYSQFDFLKPGLLGSSFYSYRAKYCIIKKQRFQNKGKEQVEGKDNSREVQIVVGYRNLEHLTKIIEPYMFRVTKEDCLDLPPKVYMTREVEMTPEQWQAYEELKRYAYTVLDGHETSALAAITQLLRLHQIVCGHVGTDDGTVIDIPNNRVKALLDVVDETSGSVIIWCNYRRDVELVAAALRDAYPTERTVTYDGGVDVRNREAAIDLFQSRRARFFVGTAASGGYGITLTAANTVIYYSNTYDLEKRSQSEDRAHRIGQTKSVTYVDLVSPGTVDERIIEALRKKIDMATAILGDGYKKWLI